jgi:carboxyl-terminal processing protease
MNRIKHILFLTALSLLIVGVAGALALSPESHYAKIVKTVAHDIPREHLSRHTLDDDVSKRFLDNFISSLDYERAYFLASDIDSFNRKQELLDDELRDGNVDFAYEVFARFKERVRDRTAYVRTLLDEGFDLTLDEEYHWKRKEAPWCKDTDEWNDLWRKRVKNEYVRRLVAKELGEEETLEEAPSTDRNEPPAKEPSIDTDVSTDNTRREAPDSSMEPLNTDADQAAEEEPVVEQPELTPEEHIQERYSQFLSTLEDSDSDWVLQKYLSAFARAYDPHCDYMSPATAEDFDIEMKLSLFGIGALLRPDDGTAKIVRLIPGGPADRDESKNRLRPGDKIISVAQDMEKSVSILHWPLYKSVRLIRGPKGTRVVLTVIPATDPTGSSTKTVTLIRDEVKLEDRAAKSDIKTMSDARGEDYRLGVIELPAFYADLKGKRSNPDYKSSSRDVSRILRDMREDGIDGVVLDLRNNGGGSLLEAVLMTGLFIKEGPTVQVRERRTVSILPDNDPSVTYDGPLVVLVNRLSASASEILAAALQDYGRAVIVGDSKTHGKGSVQTVLNLSRTSPLGSIKVTNALFYRISGGSTQLRGVKPDIVVPSAFDFMEFGEDFLPNHMEWSTINTAIYSPFGELDGILATLAARSQERQTQDDRLVAYHKLLERIKALNTRETLSLNIDTRKAQAKAEKELLDIQNSLMEQGEARDDDEEEADKIDVVEEEALHILMDLIQVSAQREKSIAEVGIPSSLLPAVREKQWTE